MLQQTTVATVTPRFEAFLNLFPNVESLAKSDEQTVLKAWEGLGYYSRARNLRKSAQILFERFGSQIPDDPDVWAELPGVGRYILGAVLSQAFDKRLPIVEANTRRVLARLGAKREKLTDTSMQRWLWQTAEEILPSKNVGDFNQAMMELGASVCTPKEPNCEKCPLKQCCESFKLGIQNEIPVIERARTILRTHEVCAVFRRPEGVLIRRRPDSGRWAGMWEFPTLEYIPANGHKDAIAQIANQLRLPEGQTQILMTIPYTVMRFRVSMICVEVFLSQKFTPDVYDENLKWVSLSELSAYPIRSSQRKLANRLTRPNTRE